MLSMSELPSGHGERVFEGPCCFITISFTSQRHHQGIRWPASLPARSTNREDCAAGSGAASPLIGVRQSTAAAAAASVATGACGCSCADKPSVWADGCLRCSVHLLRGELWSSSLLLCRPGQQCSTNHLTIARGCCLSLTDFRWLRLRCEKREPARESAPLIWPMPSNWRTRRRRHQVERQ